MTPATLNLTIDKGVTWGPLVITCKDADGVVVDLTGWTAYADARVNTFLPVVFSLSPVVSDAAAGKITFSMTDEQTNVLPDGACQYDMVLQNPAGERLGPYLTGTIQVNRIFTHA